MNRKNAFLRRRVHIDRGGGSLRVRIDHQNARGIYFWTICLCTVAFALLSGMLLHTSLRHPDDVTDMALLYALVVTSYAIALVMALWGAFGTEEIAIEAGNLRWTCKALNWTHTRDIPIAEITEIRAVTPWHGLRNCLKVVASGKQRKIGDKLLRDEAIELAQHLHQAIHLDNTGR